MLPIEEVTSSYYLRMRVSDETGVLADITRILADAGISIDAMLQKESREGEPQTDIIMLSHGAREAGQCRHRQDRGAADRAVVRHAPAHGRTELSECPVP